MDKNINDKQLQDTLKQRFDQLPPLVQQAITSADLEQHLRELADTNKLHLDQWQLLENDVMLTLLGFQEPEELAGSLEKDLEIPRELADSLAANVSQIVFEPIRTELERELQAIAPQKPKIEGVDTFFSRDPASVVAPGTPPPAPPTKRAARAPISASYAAQQPSHERPLIEGDPYREQLA